MFAKQTLLAIGGSALALAFFVFLGVRNYGGNVSALLHMDQPFGEKHHVPPGVVLYTDAAYDGMLYYQITRDLPALLQGEVTSYDSPYRFQRILLPLLAYASTFGQEDAFPMAILLINILASLGVLALTIAITKKVNIHTLTVVFNPAILVGILYMLTEPVSLFFIVLFLYLWEKNNRRLNAWNILSLILSLLARETTVFLIGLLFLWYLWKKQWKQALIILIPIPLLILWQSFLVQYFGNIGFQANSNIVSFPFQGPLQVILWLLEELHPYKLSSLGLMGFVIPLCFALGREWAGGLVDWWTRKRESTSQLINQSTNTLHPITVYTFLLTGLTFTMVIMDIHMWGAITSIGRVVTPIYAVYALYASERDTWIERTLSAILIAVSIVAAIAIASVPHPYIIS